MFRFTSNHHQGVTSGAYLKLSIWYQCTNIDVVSVMAAYAAMTLTASITTRTLVPNIFVLLYVLLAVHPCIIFCK